MAFSPDSRLLAVAHHGIVRLWDSATRQQVGPPLETPAPDPLKRAFHQLAFSPNGRVLVLARQWDKDSKAPQAYSWDLSFSRPVVRPIGDRGPAGVKQLKFSPGGRTLAVLRGTSPNTIRLWRMPDTRPVSPDLPVSYDTSMAFSPDGRLFVAISNRQLFVWDTVTQQPSSQRIDEQVDAFASSHDGRMLAIIEQPSLVHLRAL